MGMKFKPDRVYLDDFSVENRKGEKVHPHEGEWVDLIPYGASISDSVNQLALQAAVDEDGNLVNPEALDKATDGIERVLASQIVGWSITDNFHDPYPEPYKNPEAISMLPAPLLWHLVKIVNGVEEEGKDESGERS